MTEQGKVKRKPTLAESLMAVLFLIIIIVVGNVFFGLSVELMFVVAIFFVGYIGKRCGFTYKEIKDGMIGCVAENAEMMVIMLGIGFVIGTWVFAGTVPVMIGWLAELISVKYVLVLSFVFCGIIAMIIGTSSATMGTIGVIMLGVATIQGINPGIAAAAVISGSFIGQVCSLLADMVNYNASITGNTPSSAIKLCMPAEAIGAIVSIAFFFFIGMRMNAETTPESLEEINRLVETIFTCFKNSPIVLLPAVVLFLLVIKKVDVIPTLFTSGIVALLVGIFYQGFSIQAAFSSAYSGFNTSMLNLPEGTELMPQFVSLVSRGGMFSMADFLISIPIMMAYCGVLQTIGVAQVISETLLKDIKKAGNAIAVNTFASLFLCAATGSVMAPGVLASKMFTGVYERSGISRRNMVTSFQFSCTMGVLLFPWCAVTVYAQSIVGVRAIQFIPYLTLVYVPIIMNIIFGYLGIGVVKLKDDKLTEPLTVPPVADTVGE